MSNGSERVEFLMTLIDEHGDVIDRIITGATVKDRGDYTLVQYDNSIVVRSGQRLTIEQLVKEEYN